MKITIKEIAKEAGVSIATVSMILNNKDKNITDATRMRVLDAVKKHNYIPNGRFEKGDKFMNDTREHILKVAFNLFLLKSYKEVTMAELVEKTGMSKGAFYHYFKIYDIVK